MVEPPPGPLEQGPPKCRKCGQEMIEGVVAGKSGRPLSPATIVWIDKGSNDPDELAPAPLTAFGKSPRFPAFQCPDCGIIELKIPPRELLDPEL